MDLILPEEAFTGPMHMALDEALLRSVGRPTLRVYQWESSCVTFGYFQNMKEIMETHPGVPSVRRWTGGGMVVHGNDLTFSLMIPKGDPVAALRAPLFYKELHGRLAGWLSSACSLEINLAANGDERAGPACFLAPALDDLLLDGRKILGGALRRSYGALLYQGSLQISESDRSRKCAVRDPTAMAHSLSLVVSQSGISWDLREAARKLEASRYLTREWHARC